MSHILILGDIHLGKSILIGRVGVGASLNSRITDQLNLLEWTLDRAIESGIDDIIITGDVFEDPKPHPSLITLFISWLKKCQVHNINIHIIAGNHDILRSGIHLFSPLDIISEMDLENINVYKNLNTIIIDKTAITLMPFRDRKSLGCDSNIKALDLLKKSLIYELAGIPVTYHKVLVGHLAIEGSIPVGDEIDDLSDVLFCPLEMFRGYHQVWMGHVHKPQVLKKSPYIAHIGSMDISNFGETDQKKHIVIIDCENGKFTTEYLPTRPLKRISVSIPPDVKDTTDYIIKELEKIGDFDRSIVRVEVSLTSTDLKSVDKSTVDKFLYSQGVFNVAGISESKKAALIKKDKNNIIDTKMDIVSAIKTYSQTYVDEKQRSNFIETAMDIYNLYKAEAKE